MVEDCNMHVCARKFLGRSKDDLVESKYRCKINLNNPINYCTFSHPLRMERLGIRGML